MEYRNKKEEKLDSIYQAHASKIYIISMHLTEDAKLAGEVLQETFFNFYKDMERVPEDRIFTYLVLMAKHVARSKMNPEIKE